MRCLVYTSIMLTRQKEMKKFCYLAKATSRDIEGISIYPTGKGKGYILISNQQADTFNVYLREDPAKGKIAELPFSTSESDGSEVTAIPLGDRFPKGVLVAMSNGKVFHYYDWRKIEEQITKAR